MGQSYLKNAALLTGADVLLRLAGMGLRIYLANALGGEGMGLYQLVLAVYALFVTLAPAQLQLLYSSLHVMPDGAPAALLLTEECTRTVYAVQLLPPFVWEDPLPPLPDAPASLSLTLTMRDVEEIDACPAALGHRLACDKAGKRWLHHPRAETYLSERVALFQRLYR